MDSTPPLGTVSFVFTDIEGSTKLVQALGPDFSALLEQHNRLALDTARRHHGYVVKSEGDGFFMTFQSAVEAVRFAVQLQQAFLAEPWPENHPIKVRIGIHSGEGRLADGDYVGIDVHRAARIAETGHGGQTIVSGVTAGLVEYALPEGTWLEDLGRHRLRDINNEEHLFQVVIEAQPSSFPPIRTLSASKGNLPHRSINLVGRANERAALSSAIERSRLTTLTGPAGVGKTTLALKVAEDVSRFFPDGVWLVEVSRLSDASLLAPALARNVGITESPHQPLLDTLASRLSRAKALVVFDGCEHMVDEVAYLSRQLLDETTDLKILTTSRQLLSIAEENLMPLSPLATPELEIAGVDKIATYDSVALFVDRAQLVQSSFELSPANAMRVAEICRRLDGLPLAIELAAARMKVLSVDQLLERLDQQFSLLRGTLRDMPAHQQTLETTLDWSHQLLSETEQLLFARLSVFSGGFDVEAVEDVCTGGLVTERVVLDLIERLLETSLVNYSDHVVGRYRLLEPIASYAGMRLTELEDPERLAALHSTYFLSVAEEADRSVLGRDQAYWAKRVDLERYNLRKALEWLHETGRADEALRLAGALRWYWVIRRDVSDGYGWLEKTLQAREGSEDEITARALNGVGLLAFRRLDFDRTDAALTRSLQLYRDLADPIGEAEQIHLLAVAAWFRDDIDAALKLATEAEEKARAIGHDWVTAWALAVKGTIARLTGDLAEARRAMTESHRVFLDAGGTVDIGWSFLRLGAVARDEGRYPTALERYESGRSLLEEVRDTLGIAHADAGIGAMSWLLGDRDGALERFRSVLEGFSLSEEVSNNLFELKTMVQGNPSISELQDIVESNRQRADMDHGLRGASAALGEYLLHVGRTATRRRDTARAEQALAESLKMTAEAEDPRGITSALAALVVLLEQSERHKEAACVSGLAEWRASERHVAPWPPSHESEYGQMLAAAKDALGGAEFTRATMEGEQMDVDRVIEMVGGPGEVAG